MTEFQIITAQRLEPSVESRLCQIWIDATNSGGAVGFVGVVTEAVVAPFAQQLFGHVAEGKATLITVALANRVSGWVVVERGDETLTHHRANVSHLMVAPSAQHRGLGVQLMTAVREWAVREGVEQLLLSCRGGLGLEGFYVRLGYELVGSIPRALRVSDYDYRAEHFMVLHLAK